MATGLRRATTPIVWAGSVAAVAAYGLRFASMPPHSRAGFGSWLSPLVVTALAVACWFGRHAASDSADGRRAARVAGFAGVVAQLLNLTVLAQLSNAVGASPRNSAPHGFNVGPGFFVAMLAIATVAVVALAAGFIDSEP